MPSASRNIFYYGEITTAGIATITASSASGGNWGTGGNGELNVRQQVDPAAPM
jgi:hypothetical protein